MPTGIIMQSSSHGATPEAIEKVFTDNGLEPDKPAATEAEAAVEPKREDFESDDAFTTAQEEFTQKAEEAAEKEEEERERKEQAAAPPKTRKQKAIEKATKKLSDDLRAANDRIAALEGKAPKEIVKAPEAPQRDKFKTDAEYDEAMFDYRYQLRRAKEAAQQAQERTTALLKENFQNYQSSVEEFKEEHDDWDDVVNQSLAIHESVYLAVMELENGPAVTYYLGKHLAFAQKLAEMSPLAAVVEVGRLADRLKTGAPNRGEADGAAPRKPKPRLPEPVKPVSTAATASSLTSTQAAKDRNFKAFKAAQRAGR